MFSWAGRIRTSGNHIQSVAPYRLATAQCANQNAVFFNTRFYKPTFHSPVEGGHFHWGIALEHTELAMRCSRVRTKYSCHEEWTSSSKPDTNSTAYSGTAGRQ